MTFQEIKELDKDLDDLESCEGKNKIYVLNLLLNI